MNKPFTTSDQVQEYHSGDRIQCLVCNRWYKGLAAHLKAHDMGQDEYRKAFNIPNTFPLMSAASINKMRESNHTTTAHLNKMRGEQTKEQQQARQNRTMHPLFRHNIAAYAAEQARLRLKMSNSKTRKLHRIYVREGARAAMEAGDVSRACLYNWFKKLGLPLSYAP